MTPTRCQMILNFTVACPNYTMLGPYCASCTDRFASFKARMAPHIAAYKEEHKRA